jgi:enediyne biosynthesis protein E4
MPAVTRSSRLLRAGIAVGVVALGGFATAAGLLGARSTSSVASPALGAPRFVDEAAAAGVEHRYDGEFTHFVGGGVAVLDCDEDARPDLYLAGGSMPAALYRNASEAGGTLRFEAVAAPATDLTGVVGAYPLDIDGDEHDDLVVLRVGETVLLRGGGDCSFARANEAWSFDGGDAWTTAFSATWEDEAGLPTLAFGRYLELGADGRPTYECLANELVRPATSGDYAPPMPLEPGWCTLSMLFSDWDGSGRRDLRVSNDRHYYRDGEEQLWRVDPDAAPRLYTAYEGWRTMRIWGMGIASRDLTGDGHPEVYLTSQGDNKLQTLADGPGAPAFEDIALARGTTAHRPYAGDTSMPSTAWHAEFDDVNNDGHPDLFVAKGNVEAMTEYAVKDPSNLLIGQADGTFAEGAVDAGIVSFARARGAALADLNLDGLLDLVVVNRREHVNLWRNVGSGTGESPEPMGHWLAVSLAQPGANRDAIGAWVEVRSGGHTQRIEVTVGGGHASGQLGPVHVGLGAADRAEVRVTWPDGEVGPWLPVDADRYVRVDRGAGEATPWVEHRGS